VLAVHRGLYICFRTKYVQQILSRYVKNSLDVFIGGNLSNIVIKEAASFVWNFNTEVSSNKIAAVEGSPETVMRKRLQEPLFSLVFPERAGLMTVYTCRYFWFDRI